MDKVLTKVPSVYAAMIVTLMLAVIVFSSCTTEDPVYSFEGEDSAVAQADAMFDAIGGKERWCNLRSLYIKAQHEEPQMTIPYRSEIWRAIDTFELVIEQQNDSFHVKAVITSESGVVTYLDDRDTSRVLSADQLEGWKHGHDHNVYVLLHNLACRPSAYRVVANNGRIEFYNGMEFVTSFELDAQNRPYKFYHPDVEGKVQGSIFTRWGEDDGLVHSAGGHPLDSNFIYLTEIWKPSNLPLTEAFGAEIMEVR